MKSLRLTSNFISFFSCQGMNFKLNLRVILTILGFGVLIVKFYVIGYFFYQYSENDGLIMVIITLFATYLLISISYRKGY